MSQTLSIPRALILLLVSGVIPASADAVTDAKANAKSGLLLAIEELQTNAGPDQRVTARADILDANIAKPRLTGVWNSWDISATNPPAPSDYESPAKAAKFRRWLVSNPDPSATAQITFATQPTLNPATLWGTGSLGASSPPADFVTAAKVPVASPAGAYAWAVLDEGVKVRINTPFADNATTGGAKTQQLGSGERPAVESIPGLQGLSPTYFEANSPEFAGFINGIGNETFNSNAEALAPGTSAALKPLTHDVSLHSMGLFTDTAHGGLRQDFQLMTNGTTLPSTYNGGSVYNTLLGLSPSSAPSDPKWEAFREFATIYRDTTKLSNSGGVPVLKAQTPSGWQAAFGSSSTTGAPGIINPAPPTGVVLMPTVAKVQMLFSLMTQDYYLYPKISDSTPKIPGSKAAEQSATIFSPWGTNFAGTSYDYALGLIYTPLVTLHNPYNIALEFSELKVVFGNVPFAMQVFRNGVAQTTGPAPLDMMYYQAAEQGTVHKRFGMTLKTQGAGGAPDSSTIRLLPGEVMQFSLYANPNGGLIKDWNPSASTSLNSTGIPIWRGDACGFLLDWPCPVGMRVSSFDMENGISMFRGGSIPARAIDEFHVNFAPLSVPGLSNNKFTVEVFAKPSGSASVVSSEVIEMDYETPTGLQNVLLGTNNVLRYPATGTINTMAMHVHSTSKIGEITTVKPFALLSMRAKTTSGGIFSDNSEGRLATKPWSFAHASIGASPQKVLSGHPANHSHEIDLQSLDYGSQSAISSDAQGRSPFISGLSSFLGTKFGSLYDIPLAPLQTLASLNGANPGGSSGYLPRFAQPIGNSWAHPLIPTGNLSVSGSTYPYLDHSFLLNLALYDRFYFSGFAQQTGAFGNDRTTTTIASDFAGGALLDDPRLLLYRPGGSTASGLSSAVADPDAYAKIAAWQMMKGAFNINSTSVTAWKAMLASTHDAQAVFTQIDKANSISAITDLGSSTGKARISRFRLPASKSSAQGGDPTDAYWMGPREYSDSELQTLAEKIVQQIRLRGPFLSMAEFVNRRLGSGNLAQRGALQQAIDNSNLNQSLANSANAGYEIPLAAVASYNYANPTAGAGSSYQGAPGYLTQADLLNVLGNAATARSDTFTIRSYGEAHNGSGQTTASATCEAVVQRLPDWVNPADTAETSPANLVSPENQTKGRRFRVISFHWLAPGDI